MNQINQIDIYRTSVGWSFDDPRVGLAGEPFVAGIPEIIDHYAEGANKVSATFSTDAFPGGMTTLSLLREESGGGWYKDISTNLEGWLCPALFKYFTVLPRCIFVKIDKL